MDSDQASVFRFDSYELNARTGELRKSGVRVKLGGQPLEVLTVLIERAPEMATREELKNALWQEETFTDFDHGVNTAIQRIRGILGDSPQNPRFIETLPRKGYRFISAVERVDFLGDAQAPERVRPKWWATAGVALSVGAAAIWFWVGGLREPDDHPPLLATQITSDIGIESQPSFSPDGSQVAYVVASESGADIHQRVIGVGAPLRLTTDPKLDLTPAWSPDGRHIAFIRWDGVRSVADVMLVPALGGPESKVGETFFFETSNSHGDSLAWSPDGRWLAVRAAEAHAEALTLLSVETGERRRLTSPPDEIWDHGPAFSTDGRVLAFTRFEVNSSELYVLPLDEDYSPQGEPRRLTSSNSWTTHPAFTGDGSEIVFSSGPLGAWRLWRIPASGVAEAKLLLGAGANGVYPTLSRDGRRLAYDQITIQTNIWRREHLANGDVGPPQRVLSSTATDSVGKYSPNAEKIVFVSNRTGNSEIWVSRSDGSEVQQLTSFPGMRCSLPRWSPDGARIAFTSNKDGQTAVYVMDAGGGAPKRLASPSDQLATWSADGEWIYYGGRLGLSKTPSGGGGSHLVVEDSPGGLESADGKTLYYAKYEAGDWSLWRRSLPDGEESRLFGGIRYKFAFAVVEHGVYFIRIPLSGNPATVAFYTFSTGEVETVFEYENTPSHGLSVSWDGRSILYSETDDFQSDIMMVEDFQ